MQTDVPKLFVVTILIAIVTGSGALWFDAQDQRITQNQKDIQELRGEILGEMQELRGEIATHQGIFAHPGIFERTNIMIGMMDEDRSQLERWSDEILKLIELIN